MSELAIAAVTAALRSVLQKRLNDLPGGGSVTTLPPDKAETVGDANRINLFLYQTTLNAAWRNQPIPTRTKAGENGFPPLALNLHYLVTAYGDSQNDEADHRLLGSAMRTLHDYTQLKRQDILDATSLSNLLQGAALEQQFEPVHITPELLSVEEMSKLWTTFQAKYRISAAYRASVVLIESNRVPKTPLPVLKRGEADAGPDVSAQIPAQLDGIEYRDWRSRSPRLPAAQLGDSVTLLGERLPTQNPVVVLRDPQRQPTAAEPNANVVARLKPAPGSDETHVVFTLDETAGNWVSGLLMVEIEAGTPAAEGTNGNPSTSPKRPVTTNPLRFELAPILHDGTALSAITTVEQGRRKLILSCRPPLARKAPAADGNTSRTPADDLPDDISLVLTPVVGDGSPAPIPLDRKSPNSTPTTLVFDVEQIPPGNYRVRLRIATVETLVMKRTGDRLEFDEKQVLHL